MRVAATIVHRPEPTKSVDRTTLGITAIEIPHSTMMYFGEHDL